MSFGFKGCNEAFHPTSNSIGCNFTIFSTLLLSPSTAHWFQVCFSCSFWAVSIGFPPDVDPERQRDDVSRSLQIKSNQKLCVPIDGFNWARMGQGMAHIPESWSVENQYVFLSSLRELCCHSLSPSVTPQSAVATQSPLTHLSILAMMAYRSLAYSPLQKENMSSYSPQTVLKRPHSPWGISTLSSAHRSAEPSPSFIYTHLSVFLS